MQTTAMHARSAATVTPCAPTPGTLVTACYANPDYRDGFALALGTDGVDDVAEFARAYFLSQPRWLSLLSMNLMSRRRLVVEVTGQDFEDGTRVGSWKVCDRNDDEIVFGDDMGFMEYRFSMRRVDRQHIEASTAVAYKWPRLGPVYFGLVKGVHKRFVARSLRSAARYVDTTRGT